MVVLIFLAGSSLGLPLLAHLGFFTPPQQKLQKARIRQLPAAFGGPLKSNRNSPFSFGWFLCRLVVLFYTPPHQNAAFQFQGHDKQIDHQNHDFNDSWLSLSVGFQSILCTLAPETLHFLFRVVPKSNPLFSCLHLWIT